MYRTNLPSSTLLLQTENKGTKKCIEPQFVETTEITTLIKTINEAEYDESLFKSVKEFIVKNQGKPISPKDTIVLLNKINLCAESLKEFLKLIDNYLYLSCKDLLTIVENEKDYDIRTMIVDEAVSGLIDHEKEILDQIADNLYCEDKEKYREMLQKSEPRDCLFGDLKGNNFVFIFDFSGSMESSFKHDNQTYTRVQFLKETFKDAFSKLNNTQNYSIIVFWESAEFLHKELEKKLIPAVEANKAQTLDVLMKFKPGGMTNIGEALTYAFDIEQNIDQIILFSDGSPTSGVQTVDGMKDMILKKFDERKKKNLTNPPINVNLLMLGGQEDEAERKLAGQYSSIIAGTSNGIVKLFSGDK